MFRSVQIHGPVDQVPGLRQRLEAVTPLLADELRSAADRITLLWHVRPTGPGRVSVECELTDHAFGRETQLFDPGDFAGDLDEVRYQIRWMHIRILNAYLDERVEEYKRHLAQPAEV
jgi:hypothetical protein